MADVPRRPSSEYSTPGPRVRTSTAPQQPTVAAEISNVLEALNAALPGALAAQEARLLGRLNLAWQTQHGAQQSAELTHAMRRGDRNRNWAIMLGTACGLLGTATMAAVTTYRQYREDTVAVVAPVIEQTTEPIEARVSVIEDQQAKLGQDLRAIGRKVDGQASDLTAIRELLESIAEPTPIQRRRPRP